MNVFEGKIVHIVPFNDEKEHFLDVCCWCDPIIDKFGIVSHQSADCRELVESVTHQITSPDKFWKIQTELV